jgi:UDP-N-acetylglucosamine 1-carboxyvinyltransferase
MGATFESEHGYLEARADGLRGAVVSLDFPSVGATENLLMAAVAARGPTVVENAAREPEIVDLAEFLMAMGARIDGVGTPTIEIEAVDEFRPVEHTVIPDRVETGTFAIAACATRGDVLLEGARGDHLDLVLAKLEGAGATIGVVDRGIRVRMDERPRAVDLVTLPYPGFPTDLQPQMLALLDGDEHRHRERLRASVHVRGRAEPHGGRHPHRWVITRWFGAWSVSPRLRCGRWTSARERP